MTKMTNFEYLEAAERYCLDQPRGRQVHKRFVSHYEHFRKTFGVRESVKCSLFWMFDNTCPLHAQYHEKA